MWNRLLSSGRTIALSPTLVSLYRSQKLKTIVSYKNQDNSKPLGTLALNEPLRQHQSLFQWYTHSVPTALQSVFLKQSAN